MNFTSDYALFCIIISCLIELFCLYSGIVASALQAEGDATVCAFLDDEKNNRTEKYEQEWNGFWRFFNMLQFSNVFVAVSAVGINNMDYLSLPVHVRKAEDTAVSSSVAASDWDAISEIIDNDAKAFIELLKDTGIPVPDEDNIGYDVAGTNGAVIATVEIAWPDRKIAFLTEEQSAYREKLEQQGWKILTMLNAANIDIASLWGGDE